MNNMMGVKPNKKSSVILVMLLFFFNAGMLGFYSAPVDTLILDGEIIEVAQKDRSQEIDSLEEMGRKDFQKNINGNSKDKFIGFQLGAMRNQVESMNGVQDGVFLPEFIDQPNADGAGWDLSLNYRHQLSGFVLGRKELKVGLEALAGYRQFNWNSWTMDATAINQDSLVGLRKEENTLWLDYVTIFDGPVPVYELDTIQVPVSEFTFKSNQMQFRIGTYVEAELRRNLTWSFALGVDYRIQGKIQNHTTLYWLGEGGNYLQLKSEDVVLKRYVLTPYFSAGLNKMHNDKWTSGIVLTGMAPSALFNENPEIQWSAWQVGLAIKFMLHF